MVSACPGRPLQSLGGWTNSHLDVLAGMGRLRVRQSSRNRSVPALQARARGAKPDQRDLPRTIRYFAERSRPRIRDTIAAGRSNSSPTRTEYQRVTRFATDAANTPRTCNKLLHVYM
jgi:hypothetical protein